MVKLIIIVGLDIFEIIIECDLEIYKIKFITLGGREIKG